MFLLEHIFICLLIFIHDNVGQCEAEDVTVTINVKKTWHIVSDQFISFNVDPKEFFEHTNFTDTNFNIINALSPAFIRLSGPSTKILTWTDSSRKHIMPKLFSLTPSKWIQFNEWALNTNLTPIFALNDRHRINGVWDPRDSLAMMTLTDQMNYSCFWELGYECANTTLSQYVSDLTALQHILDAFPASKDYWGTIGSDFSGCIGKLSFEVIRNFLLTVENALDAINWHIKELPEDGIVLAEKDPIVKALTPTAKTRLPVMLTTPKSDETGSFRNGLEWATQIGDAAKYGFGVIFRQPNQVEMIQETPVFWISFFHKNLLGRNILDVKVMNNANKTAVYCHCTKHQNKYIRRGAITIYAVNVHKKSMNLTIRAVSTQMRSIEVQSYVLTSNGNIEDSEVFFNSEKLEYSNVVKSGKLDVQPKIRRVRSNRFFVLTLPPHSVAFYVLPGVRSPACIVGEEETDLIVEEIIEDQAAGEMATNFFDDIDTIENESRPEIHPASDELNAQWYKVMLSNPKDDHFNTTRQYLIDRAKVAEKHRAAHEAEQRKIELKQMLQERMKENKEPSSEEDSLELTSAEVKLILAQRAKKQRPKRFLPIDVMMDWAEKENQTGQNNGNIRNKRQIDEPRFSRRRSSRRKTQEPDMYNPENIPLNPEIPASPDSRLKPVKIVPEADVFVDIVRDKNSKNPDYDYLESEELNFQSSQEKFSQRDAVQSRRGRKRGKGNDDIHQKGIDPRFADGLDFYTLGEEANEWSIMDGDEQAYHYPGEMFENTQQEGVFNFETNNEWVDYGELFEVDSLKDSEEADESGYSDEALYFTDVLVDEAAQTQSQPEHQEQSELYPKPHTHPLNSQTRPYRQYNPVRNNVESQETYDSVEHMKTSDSQRQEVRIAPDRNFVNRYNRVNITDSQPQNNTIHRKKKPTTQSTNAPTTTSTTSAFPLYTPKPSSKRRKSSKDDVPEYMRFRRDISHIQKIPAKHEKKISSPNNIQNVGKVEKVKRGRRDISETTEIPFSTTPIPDNTWETTVSYTDRSTIVNSYESNELSNEMEHFKYIIGKPLDLSKMKPVNEKRSNHFQKFLINRLNKQRKKTDKKKPIEEETNIEETSTTASDLTNQNDMDIIPKMELTKKSKPNKERTRRHHLDTLKPLLKRFREKRSIEYSLENEIFGRDSIEKRSPYQFEFPERKPSATTDAPFESSSSEEDNALSVSSDESDSGWGDDDDDDEDKKIIIVARQPFGMGGNLGGGPQFIENFLKTISSVLDRVHRRLSGYFTAF